MQVALRVNQVGATTQNKPNDNTDNNYVHVMIIHYTCRYVSYTCNSVLV